MIKKAFLLLLIFLPGCATCGKIIDQDKISQIKQGTTTEQEVIQLLGNPYMKTLNSDGKTIMLYHYAKAQNRATNFIPVVNILAGGIDMKQQMLTVLIGKDGTVEQYTFNNAETPINSGLLNTK